MYIPSNYPQEMNFFGKNTFEISADATSLVQGSALANAGGFTKPPVSVAFVSGALSNLVKSQFQYKAITGEQVGDRNNPVINTSTTCTSSLPYDDLKAIRFV